MERYLIFLLCPLLHLLMMRGHSHGSKKHHDSGHVDVNKLPYNEQTGVDEPMR